MLSKEEIDILVKDISTLAELNVFTNIKMFLKAIEENKVPQDKILLYLNTWLDMTITDLEKVKDN